jgi:hypothetical protein
MRAAWQKLGEFLQQTCRGKIPRLPNPEYDVYNLDPEDAPALPEAA